MKNAISIDLEDWFCTVNLRQVINKADWDKCELRVADSTKRVLESLAGHNTKATFFVLGWIAERVPDLVREVAAAGHEIASHGYSHTPITEMTPEGFEADLKKSLDILKGCTGKEIIGYRAPSFTITHKTLWALEILQRNGIKYDSSIFPIGSHPDYGIPNEQLSVHKINNLLIEAPLSCAEIAGVRIPCSGGGYFRLFPYRLTKFLLKSCNSQGRPVIFYLHPWELDPGQPRIKLPWTKRFRHYNNLNKTRRRLDMLLNDFEFTSIREVLGL